MDFKLPHIKYISETQSKSKEERTLYYLGGEPEENHNRLTVGKVYEIRTALYSPISNMEREQIVKAYTDTLPFTPENIAKGEHYYNVNFKPLEK